MVSEAKTKNKKPFSFDSDQQQAIESIVQSATRNGGLGAVLNASETGAGKTAISCEVLAQLNVNTALVVAPLNTLDSWEQTIQEFTTLPTFRIDSTKQGIANQAALVQGQRGVYLVTREFFSLSATSVEPKLKNQQAVIEDGAEPEYTRGRQARWSWAKCNPNLDVAIVDEGHSMSNRWSAGYRTLKQLAPRELKMYLSATPFRSDFSRAWAPTRWLWPDVIDRSQARWGAQWAEYGYNPFKGGHNKMEIVGEKNPGAFVKSLPCYVRIEYEKKPVELHKIRSRLTPEQDKQYDQMLRDALTWLDENPLVAELPIVKLTRLRQMLLGEVTFNDRGDVDFATDTNSDKIRQCIALAKRHKDESILFFVDSQKFSEVLAQRLTDAGEPSYAWNGRKSKKQRANAKAAFLATTTTTTTTTTTEEPIKHLVAVPAAIAEGSDGLQHQSHIECWVNKPFDAVMVQQAEGRLNRRGQSHDKIISYELIVPGTVDEDDIARNLRKTKGMVESL